MPPLLWITMSFQSTEEKYVGTHAGNKSNMDTCISYGKIIAYEKVPFYASVIKL